MKTHISHVGRGPLFADLADFEMFVYNDKVFIVNRSPTTLNNAINVADKSPCMFSAGTFVQRVARLSVEV